MFPRDFPRQWANSPKWISERIEPGKEYKYNNTGYGLLALLVQRVVGRSFAEHMAATVFRPLGMSRTRWGLPPSSFAAPVMLRFAVSWTPGQASQAAPVDSARKGDSRLLA